jgi:hypothetical protein
MNPVLEKLITKYADLETCLPAIEAALAMLQETYRSGGKVLLCGNGGSAADCEHIVGELMKGYTRKRPLPDTIRQKLTGLFPDNGDYLADHLQGALPIYNKTGPSMDVRYQDGWWMAQKSEPESAVRLHCVPAFVMAWQRRVSEAGSARCSRVEAASAVSSSRSIRMDTSVNQAAMSNSTDHQPRNKTPAAPA